MKSKIFLIAIAVSSLTAPKRSEAQIVTQIAGMCMNGGYWGDGGQALSAKVEPDGITVDHRGNVYIAQIGADVVRKVDTDGVITTIAGIGGEGTGILSGPATAVQLYDPHNVVMGPSGELYIPERSRITKINSSGIISTVVGIGFFGNDGDEGSATAARIGYPGQVCFDAAGNLYFADVLNHVVRKVNTFGIITTVAGNGTAGYSGDGGPALSAQLTAVGVAVNAAGDIFIADNVANVVRKVGAEGTISTVIGGVDTLGDGSPASAARIIPNTLFFDAAGNLYVVETHFGKGIRKIGADGIIHTILRNQTPPNSPICTLAPASAVRLGYPANIAFDDGGSMYISDNDAFRVLKVVGPTATATSDITHNSGAMTISPVPNSGTFTISITAGMNEKVQATITDIVGHVVKELDIATNKPMEVALDVPAGIYIVKACTPGGEVWTGKVVVTR